MLAVLFTGLVVTGCILDEFNEDNDSDKSTVTIDDITVGGGVFTIEQDDEAFAAFYTFHDGIIYEDATIAVNGIELMNESGFHKNAEMIPAAAIPPGGPVDIELRALGTTKVTTIVMPETPVIEEPSPALTSFRTGCDLSISALYPGTHRYIGMTLSNQDDIAVGFETDKTTMQALIDGEKLPNTGVSILRCFSSNSPSALSDNIDDLTSESNLLASAVAYRLIPFYETDPLILYPPAINSAVGEILFTWEPPDETIRDYSLTIWEVNADAAIGIPMDTPIGFNDFFALDPTLIYTYDGIAIPSYLLTGLGLESGIYGWYVEADDTQGGPLLFAKNEDDAKSSTPSDPDSLDWKSTPKLTWGHFKGEPPDDEVIVDEDAECYCDILYGYSFKGGKFTFWVKAVFRPSKSWVKEGKQNDELLNHEQGHYDLAEVTARLVRKKFKALGTNPSDDEIAKAYAEAFKEGKDLQEQYDKETKHGTDKTKQAEWDKKIKNKLNELSTYS